jgi:hypothetical protein
MLRIFISHKMPQDTPLAQEIGEKLGLYAGERIKVSHAGQFPSGAEFRNNIEKELDEAHWLILLHTNRDADWNFCMFECGYFRAKMKSDDKARLIPMCQDVRFVSDAVSEFSATQVDLASITKLLKDIYIEEPWKLHPRLSENTLRQTAQDIVDAYSGAIIVVENFDVTANFALELRMDDKNTQFIQNHCVPADTVVTGNRNWQEIFGRKLNTAGWVWSSLITEWPHSKIYEYLLCCMIWDAFNKIEPTGTLVRSHTSKRLFRITLRRYEILNNKKHRFHFTAARLDLPFDLPADSRESAVETVMYHLINITWYFRKRIVENLYEKTLDLLSQRIPNPVSVNNLFRNIGQELMQVRAQALIRYLDHPRTLRDAMGKHDPEVQSILERAEQFEEIEKKIFDAMLLGVTGLRQVTENLYELAQMNYDWYRKVSDSYCEMARSLSAPASPDSC